MRNAWSALAKFHRRDAGVVTAEAVAVTAMFLVLTFVVAWTALSSTLSDAIGVVGDELLAFTEKIVE